MCVFSACLLPSVVTFSVSLSFPHVACQENLTGSVWTGWCHHDGAMQTWQFLEKCFFICCWSWKAKQQPLLWLVKV